MRSHMDRSIERYVAGRMSEAEQREFLRQTARDAGLRRMLRAEQTIAGAVANDRASIAAAASEPSPSLLATLAATHPEGITAVGDGAVASTVPSGVGLMGALKILGGLTATLVTVVGIVMLVRTIRTDDVVPSAPVPMHSTAPAPQPTSTTNADLRDRQAAAGETTDATQRTFRPAAQRIRATMQRREAIPGNASAIVPQSSAATADSAAAHHVARPRPTEFQEDTLRLRMEVKEKK